MENVSKDFCKEALTEGNFTAEELLEEIMVLIPDYFVCTTKKTEGGYALQFLNGQTFVLSAVESKA